MSTVQILFLFVGNLVAISASYFVGKFRGRLLESQRGKTTQPICPCGHVWGAHKDGLRCQEEIKRPHYYGGGSRNGWEYVRCGCTKYHGPELITNEFFSPGTFTS